MGLREIPLSEAIKKNIPMGFEITDAILEQGWGQLEESLRAHGWKGNSKMLSSKQSHKNSRSSNNK